MLLADKIVTLRKRAGWSQEELAAQLGVSRQSVSKWEGAQSVPDMQKVVQMSRLFGVTTDYLLKKSSASRNRPRPSRPRRCAA
ncbi:MAG: helix-turn-helix domain-containing protein [Oscillospiraceae bacterium]